MWTVYWQWNYMEPEYVRCENIWEAERLQKKILERAEKLGLKLLQEPKIEYEYECRVS